MAALANSYNPPNILIRIPADEPVYEINLDTRVVQAPKFLGVEADHEAEYIYFIMDRYYDQVDLSQCLCGIQFKNANNEEYFYIVPAYDILSIPGKIIFAWNIQSPVTRYGGAVEFSFKFFKIDKASGELLYELNTLVAKTKVLVGWGSRFGITHHYKPYTIDQIFTDAIDEEGNVIPSIWTKVQEIYDLGKKFAVEWIEAE